MSRDAPLTLDPAFRKLGREIERFANHTRKLLRASEKYRPQLEEASAWSEGAAPLDRAPESPGAAMRAIDKFARVRRESRTNLFGAYFAHHYLRSQAELSRELLRASFSVQPGDRVRLCHRIYEEAEASRRAWVSALLELSISAAAPDLSRKDYAAFNVGALTDHEDVDLAVVVATPEAKDALSRGFATVSKTFLRFASKIQLYLTEQFHIPSTGALLEEYAQLLERPTRSVVSVTQLLGAQHLSGDPTLARALEERVTQSYYAGQGRPIHHEAFLRAVMAELRHYLVQLGTPGVLSPKREIYVPAKLAITAVRVIHGVHEPRPSHALRLIAERDPELRETYLTLADAFVQNEVLRALMYLYVWQADEFDLADPTIGKAARRVAVLLGLGESARRSAEHRLTGMYTEVRARALRSVATLSTKIELHLARVSTFRQIVELEQVNEDESLARYLLDAFAQYRGSIFWDEVVELLSTRREIARRLVADLARLEPAQLGHTAARWVELMSEDAASLVELLVFFAQQEGRDAKGELGPAASGFFTATLERLERDLGALDAFIELLDAEASSESLFRLAVAYPPARLARLADLMEDRGQSNRTARVVRTTRSAIVLAHHCSNAIARIAGRVLGRTPEFVQRLGDPRRLQDLAKEIAGEAAREVDPREQIELLGDAFDVAALRASLIAILEGAPAARDLEFTSALDQYVRELFKACFREVHQRSPVFADYRPGSRIALYTTGGFGRGEAFGADWDYIAVIDEDDRSLRKFFGKVMQRVSAAMSRRGIHPHNRFIDHFGAYVVSIPELARYFANRGPETFIDEAEVLEARFLLGDPAVARRYNEEIRRLVTEAHANDFVAAVLSELRDRRRRLPRGLNLKLGPGGLREIHLLWLAIRVFAQLPGPLVPELLAAAEEALPGFGGELRALVEANIELRRARELYRLVVAFDDAMEPERLVITGRDLAPLRRAGVRGDYEQSLRKLLDASALEIDRVADEIGLRVGDSPVPSLAPSVALDSRGPGSETHPAMAHPLDDPRLDWDLLRRYDFDEARFRDDLERLRAGTLTSEASIIRGAIEPAPSAADVRFEGAEAETFRAAGEAALARGEVAAVVLNGGMATRFGGVVKGVVEVYEEKSFIALKAEDVRRAKARYGASLSLVLMNSAATEAATWEHVRRHQRFGLHEDELLGFNQTIALRLETDGRLFIGADGEPSYYAPGHGDFFVSLRRSGVLGKLIARGVKYVTFSNVDNLGATLDPVVIGHHIRSGKAMSAEVTQKQRTASGAWDKGGAPALVDGRLMLVEGFRFPADFPQERLPDFSTNNMLFTAAALDREVRLERHLVKKTVEGRAAYQLESIACEASALRDAADQPLFSLGLLRVPREGPFGRFFPVKEPPDLEALRGAIRDRLEQGWKRRDG